MSEAEIASITRENGDIIYYGYDDARSTGSGQADRLTSETWKASDLSTIYAFAWDYDAVGNRTWESRDGVETYYEYNAANELTYSVVEGEHSYYSYDSRGNCLTIQEPDGPTYFAYNHTDLVTEIKFKSGITNYFYYDAQLRRYAMQDSSGLAYFTHDQDGLCQLAERDATGTVVAEYTRGYSPVSGIGDLAGAKIITAQGACYQYDAFDNLGNAHRIVDEAGNVTGYFEYDAWGRKLRNQPPPEGTRFGQSAPAWMELKDDPDGILKLTPSRLYHAGIGRFLQRDPLPKLAVRNQLGKYTLSIFSDALSDTAPSLRTSSYAIKRGRPGDFIDPTGFAWKNVKSGIGPIQWRSNIYEAQTDEDTLSSLAIEVSHFWRDWVCIKPIGDPRLWKDYAKGHGKAKTCARADVSPLRHPGVELYMSIEDDDKSEQKFWKSRVWATSKAAYRMVRSAASWGRTPIRKLIVAGHGEWQEHVGDPVGIGRETTGADDFYAGKLATESRPASFDRARRGVFPHRCWFTRGARVYGVGCYTNHWAAVFAKANLRRSARACGTKSTVGYEKRFLGMCGIISSGETKDEVYYTRSGFLGSSDFGCHPGGL